MKYVYFVSYAYEKGFGMIEISVDKEIRTYDDVVAMLGAIKEKNGLDVTIINWKRLEK